MHFSSREFKWVAVVFILWRVALLIVGWCAPLVLDYRPDFSYTRGPVIESVTNFDGVHYLNIAKRGYVDEFRFLPLLPLLLSVIQVHGSVGLWIDIIGIQLIALGALCMVYRVIRLDYSIQTSRVVIAALLVFPTSFFLGAVYTEGLFLGLAAGALYLGRQERWVEASLLTACASATRIVGIMLVPVLLMQLWIKQRKTFLHHWKTILVIVMGCIGLVAYSAYLYRTTGNPLLFLEGHTQLGNSRSTSLVNPLRTVVRYGKILVSLSPRIHEWWVALLEISSFVWIGVTTYFLWRTKNKKDYLWYILSICALPIFSGTFTGLPRYALVLFPLFITVARIENRLVKIVYFGISSVLLIICTILFSRGYFVA